MNLKKSSRITLVFLIISSHHSIKSGCPLACPTGTSAQFCGLNASTLCVTGNAQIGGVLTVCGSINAPTAYGYFYDPVFTVLLSTINPTKIPFTNAGAAAVLNIAHPNATDAVIQLSGIYRITYMIEPTSALNSNGDFQIQVNGTAVPGSTFTLAAALSNIEISGQSIVVANAGDVISVVTTALALDTTLAGKSSLIIEKIA